MEIDHDLLIVRVDWHGYAIDQVETWADKVIKGAYDHGFEYVEFVHGAPDFATRGTLGWEGDPRRRDPRGGPTGGRGTIKDILRKRLYGRRWSRWVADPRDGTHTIEEGSMRLALLANPGADASAKWPLLPPPAHG